MAFPQGRNFRNTAVVAGLADPSSYSAEIATTANYPTTSPEGNTVGWEQAPSGTRDRGVAGTDDARVYGIAFVGTGPNNYRIDLPATGNYGIQIAVGDLGSNQGPCEVQLLDGSSAFATPVPSGTSIIGGQFYGANGTLYTSEANWLSANPAAGGGTAEITHNFTSTIFRVAVGFSTGFNTPIASIFIRSIGAAAPKFRRTLTARVGSRQAA